MSVKQRLFCADCKAGGLIPHRYADIVHGTKMNKVLHFDYLYVGPREVGEGIDTPDVSSYLFVLSQDLGG